MRRAAWNVTTFTITTSLHIQADGGSRREDEHSFTTELSIPRADRLARQLLNRRESGKKNRKKPAAQEMRAGLYTMRTLVNVGKRIPESFGPQEPA